MSFTLVKHLIVGYFSAKVQPPHSNRAYWPKLDNKIRSTKGKLIKKLSDSHQTNINIAGFRIVPALVGPIPRLIYFQRVIVVLYSVG